MSDDPRRIQIDPLEFFRLTSAHGDIFEADVRYRVKIESLHAEAKKAVSEKQQAFDVLVQTLAKAHDFDAASLTQWDKDTCELILTRPT